MWSPLDPGQCFLITTKHLTVVPICSTNRVTLFYWKRTSHFSYSFQNLSTFYFESNASLDSDCVKFDALRDCKNVIFCRESLTYGKVLKSIIKHFDLS